MKFDDYITALWARPKYEEALAHARIERLCMQMVHMLQLGLCVLKIGQQLGRVVRRSVRDAAQAMRDETKLHMLRTPAWRLRVIKELGGIDKLLRLWTRLAFLKQHPQHKVKRRKTYLSYAEQRRRLHIQRCAKACAHPRVFRDPFRVDREGQFRLPPMPRRSSKGQVRTSEYNYDARPVMDFKGLNAPIMVWPEEFFVFLDWEERPRTETVKPRRYSFVDKWLAAIVEAMAEAIPPQPRIKTKTARAPPCLVGGLRSHHLSIAAGG